MSNESNMPTNLTDIAAGLEARRDELRGELADLKAEYERQALAAAEGHPGAVKALSEVDGKLAAAARERDAIEAALKGAAARLRVDRAEREAAAVERSAAELPAAVEAASIEFEACMAAIEQLAEHLPRLLANARTAYGLASRCGAEFRRSFDDPPAHASALREATLRGWLGQALSVATGGMLEAVHPNSAKSVEPDALRHACEPMKAAALDAARRAAAKIRAESRPEVQQAA